MKTRVLTLLLALVMLAACFCACGDEETTTAATAENKTTTTEKTSTTTEATVETDENGFELDSLGDIHYDDRAIKILMTSQYRDSICPTAEAAKDIVVKTMFKESMQLEEDLGIIQDVTLQAGAWSDQEAWMAVAEKAGENGMDVICSYSLWPCALAIKGCLVNLKNCEYPELDKPWWPESVRLYEQKGALYFVANNSSILVWKSMEIMFVNQGMADDYELGNVPVMVLDYKWTLDMMNSMAKTVRSDPDTPEESRVYGLASDDISRMDGFYYGCGGKVTTYDEETKETTLVVGTKSNIDHVSSIISKMQDTCDSDSFYIEHDTCNLMIQNQVMFMEGSLSMVLHLQDASTYTAIPIPLYDETQEAYQTINNNGYDVWCVPYGASDPEFSAIYIEAVASRDYRATAPFYFDTYLLYRYTANEIGERIFRLLRSTIIYDFGRIAQVPLGVTESTFRSCFGASLAPAYNNNYATNMAKALEGYENKYLETISKFALYKDNYKVE